MCGRGYGSICCELSTGTSFGSTFTLSLRYSDARSWGAAEYYWGTIRLADIDGDGGADVCGRDSGGMVCGI